MMKGIESIRQPLGGWRLVGVVFVLLLAMGATVAAVAGGGVDGVRAVIRWTARSSLALFLLAFTASAVVRLWPGPWTRWQRRNRRYLGVSFALSHAVHGVAIVTLVSTAPIVFWQLSTVGSIISGGLAYVFIMLMAATSFDRTAAWIGRRAWRWLHTAGAWYIWLSFMVTFGKRVPGNGWYAVAIVLLAAALVLKVRAALDARRNVRLAGFS